jgi:hypothetical protein
VCEFTPLLPSSIAPNIIDVTINDDRFRIVAEFSRVELIADSAADALAAIPQSLPAPQ